MSTIICTPGGSSDNCYVTAAEANSYFASDLRGEEWQDYDEERQRVALIQATRDIEERLGGPKTPVPGGYTGDSSIRYSEGGALATVSARVNFWRQDPNRLPYDSDQALAFPRAMDTDENGDIIVPDNVKTATYEQAFYLLHEAARPQPVDFDRLREEGVTSVGGSQALVLGAMTRKPGIAPRTHELMMPYCAGAAPIVL